MPVGKILKQLARAFQKMSTEPTDVSKLPTMADSSLLTTALNTETPLPTNLDKKP